MSPASLLSRCLRPVLPAVLTAFSLAATTSAQTTIQGLHDIGLEHAQSKPYNFTGRVFDIANVAFGSGTLLRRHTVQTAGHVVFDPATGFLTYASFTRALYEDYSLSINQVVSAQALSGYQAAAINEVTDTSNTAFLEASSFDMGLVLLADAPVDDDWADYTSTPSLLSTAPTFVLGYPGVSFDGRTMAYVVPSTPWVPLGLATTSGGTVVSGGDSTLYEIDDATAEPGTSGGPIYVVPDGVHQYVEASVVGSTAVDSSAEFNDFIIHAIDKSSAKFLADAEYTSGLITRVKISGPKTVSRGHTYTYTATIVFATAAPDGSTTTDRYTELKLKSNTPGTAALPLVTATKTSNTTFSVTFSNNIHSGSQTTLQIFYDKTATPLGKSSKIVKVQ